MKIKCNTEELSTACQNVQRAASTKTAIPAIEGILMRAENGKLILTGYDLEMGITTSISASVEEEGELVLNAHMFSETLRKLPEVLESSGAEVTLMGAKPDYPSSKFGYIVPKNTTKSS